MWMSDKLGGWMTVVLVSQKLYTVKKTQYFHAGKVVFVFGYWKCHIFF